MRPAVFMVDDPTDLIGPAEPVDVVTRGVALLHRGKVWVSCPYCHTLASMTSRGRYVADPAVPGGRRPICWDCTHDIEHAEADAEDRRLAEAAAFDPWEHLNYGEAPW